MTKYRFYENRKVAVWERIYFSIEAATIEEAEAKAAAMAHTSLYAAACDDAAIEIEESETHYDTIQEITPPENEGRATVRIHSVDDDNYRMIADNGPTRETNETLN
ncbi:hypothetical protein [Alistipes putredinis]|uniref:hypothetical protein n=1 Tax=Alistipes putredinis TaxID=28117 RepID=UPI003AB72BF0